jgi:hypothetical protein
MLVKTITYEDFNGRTRTEEFRFNYSKADVSRLQMSTKEGLDKFLERIVKEEDRTKMFGFLEEFILKAYGEISEDGRRFVKSEELSTGFSQTNAYSALLEEFIEGGDKAISDFVAAVIPKTDNQPQDHKAPAQIAEMPKTN